MLGELTSEKNRNLKDLNWREVAYFSPLLALVFWIGLYPAPFFRMLERNVAGMLEMVQR